MHTEKTLVGLVVTSVFLSIISDGISNALNVYLYSIICTAGAGLIFWIPIWYGVGWILFEIVIPTQFYSRSEKYEETWTKSIENRQQPKPAKSTVQLLTQRLDQELRNDSALSRNLYALANYITKARTKGLNDEQISKNLTTNGWPTDSITAAFQMVGNGA